MTEFNTSGTYAAWELLERLLSAVSWPPAPDGGDGVAVWFGDPGAPPEDIGATLERVVVVGAIQTPTEDWGPIGNQAREERFRVPVYASTSIHGRTAVEVRTRLRELTSVIEGVVRAVNAGRRGGIVPAELAPFPSWQMAISSVAPMTPSADAGHVGVAEVVVEFLIRVGTPALS